MENKENLIKRGRAGGCPTRLQKHAPASLEMDKVLSGRPANPFGEASKAIPLLSPLILSPQPLYADTTIQALSSKNNGNDHSSSTEGRISSSSTPTTAWEHPAMASFPEPTLCSVFQKQCVFVNHGQWNSPQIFFFPHSYCVSRLLTKWYCNVVH